MVVAQYDVRLADVHSPEGIPVGHAVSAGVIAELERHGDALSHAMLRGLEYLGTDGRAGRSADAVARMAEAGIGLTAKFGDVGQARPVGAWREGGEDEYAFFLDFEFPLGARHALALLVESRHGGTVKHIGLMRPMSDLEPDDPFHPDSLEPLHLSAAGTLLSDLLARSFRYGTDDYRVLIAQARARATVAVR
jgi:hypothetical protein